MLFVGKLGGKPASSADAESRRCRRNGGEEEVGETLFEGDRKNSCRINSLTSSPKKRK